MRPEIILPWADVVPQGGFVLQAVKRITELSVNEMLVTIGRAYLASGQESAVSGIRSLSYVRLLQEYSWSVAYLMAKGLLTDVEESRAGEYAAEYLDGPFS